MPFDPLKPDPFADAEERCYDFAHNMMMSYYLHGLSTLLQQAEAEGEIDSLEVQLSVQIVLDTLEDESAVDN